MEWGWTARSRPSTSATASWPAASSKARLKTQIARDWLLAPIVVAQSGRPFNLLLGFDANADGRSQSDRPGQAGRNTGRGEAFYSFDMRLARRFFVKESRYLEFTVEGFNLFNRTNFQGINNVIGGACVDTTGCRCPARVA